MNVLVTGAAGLVGAESCLRFAEAGWNVLAVENYARGRWFGEGGETRRTMDLLRRRLGSALEVHEADVRDVPRMRDLVRRCDAIIHTAAQPSHPKSIEIPLEDFSINVQGTLGLLEVVRETRPNAVFVFCSTNKVYGDNPNRLPLVEKPTRFDFADRDGVDESCPMDGGLHTPFGVSKAAADLYTQEYGRLYGLKTGVFRMGCITGGLAQAVEMHNWEPYFVGKNLSGELLRVYGHGGKQVRDVIHARDLVDLFARFVEQPRAGEVYNVGGGRANSTSLLEAFDLIESMTGRSMKYEFGPAREGDHVVYITDLTKVRSHFAWDVTIGLREIFSDIYESLRPHS